MNIFKVTTTVMLLTAFSTIACWWNQHNFNGNYIAGVNNYQRHCIKTSSHTYTEYYNNISVAMPLTVYVRIHDIQIGSTIINISRTVLQYRIQRNERWITNWITVRTINNPTCGFDLDQPVALFGAGTIDPKNLQLGDAIFLRYYVTDGIFESGELSADIDNLVCHDVETLYSWDQLLYSKWTPPFIFKVIWNGQRRISW